MQERVGGLPKLRAQRRGDRVWGSGGARPAGSSTSVSGDGASAVDLGLDVWGPLVGRSPLTLWLPSGNGGSGIC